MSNFSPYSSFSVASLIKEATAGTPLVPTTPFAFLSESIEAGFGELSVQEMSGERIRDIRSVPDKIELGGDIEFLVEPKRIGNFLRSLFGAPTTQTLVAATSFRHRFNVGDTPLTYTFDIQPADAPWVHRFYGVQINKLAFSIQDNLIKCVCSLMPRKAFIAARVTAATSSGTNLPLDQTSGLVVGDVLRICQNEDGYTSVAEHTISAIVDENNVTVNTISASIDATDIAVIKRQSLTYSQDLEFTWLGGAQLYTGDDIDNTTAEDFEDFSLEFLNEVEARFFAGVDEEARYAGDILTKGFSASGNVMKFYDSQSKLDKARKNEALGLRVLVQGETAISANSAIAARTYWGTGNGFYVEADATGKASNDWNVTIVIAANDTLAASLAAGTKNITISLANTTASKNTGTLIATAVAALTGVTAAAEGTGAQQFTAAVANANLGTDDPGGTAGTVGRDASEKPYLQFDMADARIQKYSPNASEDAILEESIPLKFYKDTVGAIKKDWLCRIFLVNDVSSY